MARGWYFASTGGGPDDGINDSGIETFGGNTERFVARECIQNSLDAIADDSQQVTVQIELMSFSPSDIPGRKELENIMQRAKEYSVDQEFAQNFYSKAIQVLNSDKIRVLKISDYGTKGLIGTDENKKGSWYGLVRSNGTSIKEDGGGGSFGIGKGAPFAASKLRTVLYSTFNLDGESIFQGVSRLSSFEDNNHDVRRGVGQFGNARQDNRPGVASIRHTTEIPSAFQRYEPGTDLYILGFQSTSENWSGELLGAVIESFWMSIYSGMLVVKICDHGQIIYDVNKMTVDGYIKDLPEDDETRLYYEAVISPTQHFQDELPLLGKVDLYIRLGKGRRQVQGMRRPRMKIHTFSRFRVLPEDYVGVFIVRDQEGNKNLRSLEPPAHDSWDEKRNANIGQEIIDTIRKWITASLKSIATDQYKDTEEIIDVARYLPADIDEESNFDSVNDAKGQDTPDDYETADEKQKVNSGNTTLHTPVINREAEIVKKGGVGDGEEARSSQHKKSGEDSELQHPPINPETDGDKRYIDVNDIDIRTRETRTGDKLLHTITLLSQRDDRGDIKIVAIADDATYPMAIQSVTDQFGRQYEINDAIIKDIELTAGKPLKLSIELPHNRRYMIGVNQ